MANNVGITTQKLPRIIGEVLVLDSDQEWSSVTMITGELDLGCIIFDEDGTMGICSGFSRDEESNPVYTIRTTTLNTQIDVARILAKRY